MYELIHDNNTGKLFGVRRLSDGAAIPPDPQNRDFVEFLAWNNTAPQPLILIDLTPAELAIVKATLKAADDAANPERTDLRAQAQAAIDANNAFLALASPTNAQTLAQVKDLTRQNTRIIKYLRTV